MYAVLIPLVKTENGDALLLEVRSRNVTQPGEVCFPGGRMEPGETAEETAVRESCEELGISPGDIEITSVLVPRVMGDGRKVYPVEARLDAGVTKRLRLSEDEVSEVFLLPLSWLDENPPLHYCLAETPDEKLPEKLREYLSHYGSYRETGETDYIEHDNHGIWGLTARLILAEYTLKRSYETGASYCAE